MKKLFMLLVAFFMFTGITSAEVVSTTSNFHADPPLERFLDQLQRTAFTFMVGSEAPEAVATGTGIVTFRIPYACKILGVRASVSTAPSADLIIDINESGTTIFGNYVDVAGSTVRKRLYIQSGSETSKDCYLATSPTGSVYKLTDTTFAEDAEITLDVDATTGGVGLKVTFYLQPTEIPNEI